MAAETIDGRRITSEICGDLKKRAEKLKRRGYKTGLAAITVGGPPDALSCLYFLFPAP